MVKMPVTVNLGFEATIDKFRTDVSKPLVKQKPSFRVPSPFSRCKKTKPVSLWKRQQQTEEYMEYLQFNPVIAEKLRIKRSTGPGYYDLDLSTLKASNMAKGTGFGTSKRSILAISSKTPGPSTYFPKILDRPFVLKKHFGNKSLFGEPYRWAKNKYENNTIPPNRYRHTYGIDELLKKRVSKKGPYQTFTGPRDHTTIRNHFAPTHSLGEHFYIGLNSDLDFLLNHPSKKNCGVVYRTPKRALTEYCDRLHEHTSTCVVGKDTPGPCSYNITQHTIKPPKESKIPFNSSTKQWRYQCPIDQYGPGPGRYFLDGFNLDSSRSLTPNQRLDRIKAKREAYSPYGECEPSTASTKSRPYLKARKKIEEIKRKYYQALLASVEELAAQKAGISYPVKDSDKLLPIKNKRDIWVLGLDPKSFTPIRKLEKILAEHTAVREVSIQRMVVIDEKLDYLYINVTIDPDSSINSDQLANYYRRRTNRKLALPLKIVKEGKKSKFGSKSKVTLRSCCCYQKEKHEADFLLHPTDSSYRPWKGLIKMSSDIRPHWSPLLLLRGTEKQNESEPLDESDNTKQPSIEFIKQSGSTKNPWKGLIKLSSSTRPRWDSFLKRLASAKQTNSKVLNQPKSTEQLLDELIDQRSSTKQSSKRLVRQSSNTRPLFNHCLRRLGSSKQKSSKVFNKSSGTKLPTSEFRNQSNNTNLTKRSWRELIKQSSSTNLPQDRPMKRLGNTKQPLREITKQSSSIRQLWRGHLKEASSNELHNNRVLTRSSISQLPLYEFLEQSNNIKHTSSRNIKPLQDQAIVDRSLK